MPGLKACEADPLGDARALARLADWCGRYTPWTAVDGSDGVRLDVTGCAHLFGGEAALLEDLTRRVAALGFASRAALAGTPGAAWAVARFGPRKKEPGEMIVPPGAEREALAALSVAGLRLAPALVEELERLGLSRIGDLDRIPRGALTKRFGVEPLRRLDEALGLAFEPISPRRPATPYHTRLSWPEPIGDPASLAAGTRRLLGDLCARMERDHRGARRLELALYRVDGGVERASVGTSRPAREVEHLMGLFAERLERLDPGFGVEVMALRAGLVESLPATQLSLRLPPSGGRELDSSRPPAEGMAAEIGRLVDRLGNRFGFENVVRFAPRASHLPERAAFTVPAGLPEEKTAGAWPRERSRPLRLLARPEPVEAVAMVPDAPPVMFRRRTVVHRIARAEGPERIEPEWWRGGRAGKAPARDYYQVEDTEGRRFWLYRDGPYRPGASPSWYLHGIFA